MSTMRLAEFARRHGVSKPAVSKWRSAGRIVMVGDQVDVEASDALLADAKLGRFKADGPAPEPRRSEPVAAVAPPPPMAPGADAAVADIATIEAFLSRLLSGEYGSQAEAERVKENALAGIRALELQRKAGALVEMEVAQSVLFEAGRATRDAWMNWPARIGPMLAADLSVEADKLTEALTRYVHEHLAELGEPEASFGTGEG